MIEESEMEHYGGEANLFWAMLLHMIWTLILLWDLNIFEALDILEDFWKFCGNPSPLKLTRSEPPKLNFLSFVQRNSTLKAFSQQKMVNFVIFLFICLLSLFRFLVGPDTSMRSYCHHVWHLSASTPKWGTPSPMKMLVMGMFFKICLGHLESF